MVMKADGSIDIVPMICGQIHKCKYDQVIHLFHNSTKYSSVFGNFLPCRDSDS